MRYVLNLLLLISWGLWTGGLMATFVFGLHLFHTHRDIAAAANSAMFDVFAMYQLPLTAVALLATGLILVTYRSKPAIALLLLLIMAGGTGITAGLGFTPAMESLRAQGKSGGAAFKRLHAKAGIAMSAEAALLVGCGAVLPLALRDDRKLTLADGADRATAGVPVIA